MNMAELKLERYAKILYRKGWAFRTGKFLSAMFIVKDMLVDADGNTWYQSSNPKDTAYWSEAEFEKRYVLYTEVVPDSKDKSW